MPALGSRATGGGSQPPGHRLGGRAPLGLSLLCSPSPATELWTITKLSKDHLSRPRTLCSHVIPMRVWDPESSSGFLGVHESGKSTLGVSRSPGWRRPGKGERAVCLSVCPPSGSRGVLVPGWGVCSQKPSGSQWSPGPGPSAALSTRALALPRPTSPGPRGGSGWIPEPQLSSASARPSSEPERAGGSHPRGPSSSTTPWDV